MEHDVEAMFDDFDAEVTEDDLLIEDLGVAYYGNNSGNQG
jgi:hypothetical protein